MASEKELESSIDDYKDQIAQIDQLLASESSEELANLKADLEQLLQLTQESLLELKRTNLLATLESFEGGSNQPTTSHQSSRNDAKWNDSNKTSEDSDDLVASKCRVKFECSNSNLKMHNALVLGTDSTKDDSVRVVFCNPTQRNMKICDHFMNGTCKFGESCKFSHGHLVHVEDLEPFLEPVYDQIQTGSSCLAKHTDELWHLATIQSVEENNIVVQFKRFNKIAALPWSSVVPLDDGENLDEGSDFGESSDSDSSDNDEINYPQQIVPLPNEFGQWEQHTRGIGSKLMAKMGYVAGKGLGKSGEGRVDPVEVIVLPEGNISLDKVMELKEKNLLKKEKKRRKRPIKAQNESSSSQPASTDVFDFINEKLRKDKDTITSPTQVESKTLLKSSSKTGLNVQILETHNKIKDCEKSIVKLRESLKRNMNSDKATIEQIKKKLSENEKTLSDLKKSEQAIDKERIDRKRKHELF